MISIDDAVDQDLCELPNFIKLDIHSAEYEAILGSKSSLDNCLGFLVETWHIDIHKGQYLSADVEKLLNSYGFFQFYNHQNSSWPYSIKPSAILSDRRHVVGSETLYFRKDVPPHLSLMFIGLLELFGYGALAVLKYNEYCKRGFLEEDKELIKILHKNIKKRELFHVLNHPLKSLHYKLYELKRNLLKR